MRLGAAIWCAAVLVNCCAFAAEKTDHWAFQPVRRPNVPPVEDEQWARNDIDRFLLARLESAGIRPAPQAAPDVLLRRTTFDLAGRPPTIAEQDAWIDSPDQAGWQAVVDRLLASPEFGERWGQHWLDVARYAESSGGGRSLMFPEAWRYRDYVIAALNDDMPFDQFIVEQLAGDQLPSKDDAERDRHTIATGFLTLGAINYEAQDKQQLEMDIVDEQVDTIGRAFLGLSLGCARCHDHKFDPIATEEYYGLAGIFTSTKSVVHENVGRPMTKPLAQGEEIERYQKYRKQLGQLEKELALLKKKKTGESERSDVAPSDPKLPNQIKSLEKEIAQFKKHAPRKPVAMAVVDKAKPGDTQVRIAGDVHLEGQMAPRTFVSAAGLPEHILGTAGFPKIAAGTSGRLELARWIASEENRLTSRVIVNRVWHHLLGAGIVRSTDDFGTTGDPPTHPELLDYLATTFVDDGWSLKSLIRRIVTSRVYSLSSDANEAVVVADPTNSLLGRARRRQLDPEAMRNAMLAVSGQLDPQRGGMTIDKIATYDTDYKFASHRRSIYVPRFRNAQPAIVAAFGGANTNMVTGTRSPSILATQALFLLNGSFVIESATHAAQRILDTPGDDNAHIEMLYRLTLGRAPTPAEFELADNYLQEMCAEALETSTDWEQRAWSGLVQLLFCSLDFRYLN